MVKKIMERIYNTQLKEDYQIVEVRVSYTMDGLGSAYVASIHIFNYSGIPMGYGSGPDYALLDVEEKISHLKENKRDSHVL